MPVVKLDDTLEMYYDDDDYTDPWRPRETIVLHHGNGKNARLWYAWVPLLSRQYRVIRVDARGFGRSSIPPQGYGWSLSNFGTDLLNLMDHLEVDRFHLIGETIGGTISLQLAYDHPERLHSVTTCTSPYNFVGVGHYLDYYRIIETEGVESWVRQSANRRLVPGKSNPEHHEWYAQQMMQSSGRVVMELLSYLSKVDLSPILPQIKVPALILVAQNSDANTPDRADNMAELIPNSTLVKIPDASGYVQHSEPEKCVEAWREFVGNLSHQKV